MGYNLRKAQTLWWDEVTIGRRDDESERDRERVTGQRRLF